MDNRATPKKIIEDTVKDVYSISEIDGCLARISAAIGDLADPLYSSWVLLDRRNHLFYNTYVSDRYAAYKKQYHEMVRKDGWSHRLVDSGQKQYFPDARQEQSIHPDAIRVGLRSIAMYPVIANRDPVGAMFVNHNKLHYFKKKTLEHVETLLGETSARLIQLPFLETDAGQKEILVLEHDPQTRGILLRHIQDAKLTAVGAESVEDAFHFVMARNPVAVWIDNRLPDGDGLEFGSVVIQMCRDQSRRLPSLILMTDEHSPAPVRTAIARGFYGVYPKSFMLGAGTRQVLSELTSWTESLERLHTSDSQSL